MNSVPDPRESYFKNKAIDLMGKGSVIKSFNEVQNSKSSHGKKNKSGKKSKKERVDGQLEDQENEEG